MYLATGGQVISTQPCIFSIGRITKEAYRVLHEWLHLRGLESADAPQRERVDGRGVPLVQVWHAQHSGVDLGTRRAGIMLVTYRAGVKVKAN
jgi:hypothetical protein